MKFHNKTSSTMDNVNNNNNINANNNNNGINANNTSSTPPSSSSSSSNILNYNQYCIGCNVNNSNSSSNINNENRQQKKFCHFKLKPQHHHHRNRWNIKYFHQNQHHHYHHQHPHHFDHHNHQRRKVLPLSIMLPPYFIIKICNQHYKVPSQILCQSSQFFDALIRFHNENNYTTEQSESATSESTTTIPIIDMNEIEILENEKHENAFRKIMNRLLDLANDNDINNNNVNYNDYEQQKMKKNEQQVEESLDFLFDCVLICSKYFFDYLERTYSDEFVEKLRNDTSELEVTDIIIPRDYNANDNVNNSNKECWLSILEIYRLAKGYNLEYLSAEILELIKEKRSYFLRRLRNTYYFW